MAQFQDLPDGQSLSVCTTCGGAVAEQAVHSFYHQQEGQPDDLSGLGGVNDPGPMPKRS